MRTVPLDSESRVAISGPEAPSAASRRTCSSRGERVGPGGQRGHREVHVDHLVAAGHPADGVQQAVGRGVLVDHAEHLGSEDLLDQARGFGRRQHDHLGGRDLLA
ncbi:hypothetical protein GCM10029964_099070 [Kibdelosporangium lantanae]